MQQVDINQMRSVQFSFSKKHEHLKFQCLRGISNGCVCFARCTHRDIRAQHAVASRQSQSMGNRNTPSWRAKLLRRRLNISQELPSPLIVGASVGSVHIGCLVFHMDRRYRWVLSSCVAQVTMDVDIVPMSRGSVCGRAISIAHFKAQWTVLPPPPSNLPPSRVVRSWRELENDASNPCGISKKRGSVGARWYGNSLTATLSCGIVADIIPLARNESFIQVYGMTAEIVAQRRISFVVYDNACVLKRFVENVARKRPTANRRTNGSQCALCVQSVPHHQPHRLFGCESSNVHSWDIVAQSR